MQNILKKLVRMHEYNNRNILYKDISILNGQLPTLYAFTDMKVKWYYKRACLMTCTI